MRDHLFLMFWLFDANQLVYQPLLISSQNFLFIKFNYIHFCHSVLDFEPAQYCDKGESSGLTTLDTDFRR